MAAAAGVQSTDERLRPYRAWIEEAVRRGRLAMAIWQDLVDDHGFPARYASVRCFLAKLRHEGPREAHPVIVTAPGQEGQIDYGDGPMVRIRLIADSRLPWAWAA